MNSIMVQFYGWEKNYKFYGQISGSLGQIFSLQGSDFFFYTWSNEHVECAQSISTNQMYYQLYYK